MADLVLTFDWYVADDWYGKNYRILLSEKPDVGFKTKFEAGKQKTALKNYIAKQHKLKVKTKSMVIGERDTFKDYEYCANGPSQDWTHFNISLKDL